MLDTLCSPHVHPASFSLSREADFYGLPPPGCPDARLLIGFNGSHGKKIKRWREAEARVFMPLAPSLLETFLSPKAITLVSSPLLGLQLELQLQLSPGAGSHSLLP